MPRRLSSGIDVFTHWGEKAAERYTARLPPAPRCPL
jgi:hypothetical protein